MTTVTADIASEVSRKFASLDTLATERECIQVLLDGTRNRLSTLNAHDAHIQEQTETLFAEQEFLAVEGVRIQESVMDEDNPPQPHVRAALVHAVCGMRDDVDRMKRELDVLKELRVKSHEERQALMDLLEEQLVAFVDPTGRWLDVLKEIATTAQSVREGIIVVTCEYGLTEVFLYSSTMWIALRFAIF